MSRDINHLKISQELGGVAIPGRHVGFGGFKQVRTLDELRSHAPSRLPDIEFTDSDNRVIVKAFEAVRDGLSPDSVLIDPARSAQFVKLCRELGLKHHPSVIRRRLLRMRKQSGGSPFKKTTTSFRGDNLQEKYGPAVEYALVRTRARYGATVDDILIDEDIAKAFEHLSKAILPGGTRKDYRLTALQIRKARRIGDKFTRTLFDETNGLEVLNIAEPVGNWSSNIWKSSPSSPGILVAIERQRPLYVWHTKNISHNLEYLTEAKLFDRIGEINHFFKPDTKNLQLSVIEDENLDDIPSHVAQLRIIKDTKPLLNLPVATRNSAA
ncbi:MAG: hypothetical protein ACIAQ0_00385 [Phycisphaerales bacterium JB058]